MAGLGMAAATLLAVGAATAHGGYGPGQGMGCGAGYGPGPAAGAQGGGAGCGGYGPGMRQGMGGRGAALLTDEERTAHRAKMQSLASYDECKAYMADFSKQLQAKAKDKGATVGGPNEAMCDRMQAHGRFTK
jgi:hypothetical protein